MKRGISLSLLFVIILITFVAAQEEFSVRFHSFGKNATIDLKEYLGESDQYLSSSSLNVIVRIDQETGIATLIGRIGWEGSEVVFFRTNESLQRVEDEEEIAKFLPAVPEILYLRKIREEELVRLFEGTIDPSILALIKEIRREEIIKLSKEIKGGLARIRINDEVDLKMEMGYIPTFSMDFSLAGEEEEEEEEIEEEKKEGLKLKISNTMIIIILSLIAIVGIYFYGKHARAKEIEKKDMVLERTIVKDIKQLSLNKLQRLQQGIEKEGSSDRFIKIFREFFSKYFIIEYDFEFRQLISRVKNSDIRRHKKKEVKNFIDDVSKMIYFPSEKWTGVYGEGQIPKKHLKKLITKLKSIIRKL